MTDEGMSWATGQLEKIATSINKRCSKAKYTEWFSVVEHGYRAEVRVELLFQGSVCTDCFDGVVADVYLPDGSKERIVTNYSVYESAAGTVLTRVQKMVSERLEGLEEARGSERRIRIEPSSRRTVGDPPSPIETGARNPTVEDRSAGPGEIEDVVFQCESVEERIGCLVISPLNQPESDLRLNPYYPVRNFYIHIFHLFKLTDRIHIEDKAEILRAVINNLSTKEAVALKVLQYQWEGDLVVSLRVMNTPSSGAIVTLISNVNAQTRKVIRSGAGLGDALAISYELAGDKLIETPWKYSASAERRLQASDDNVSLAQLYLLDEKTDNDGLIEPLLLEARANAKSPVERQLLLQVMTEYYLFSGDIDQAEAVLKEWGEVIGDSNGSDREALEHFFVQEREIAEIYRRIAVSVQP